MLEIARGAARDAAALILEVYGNTFVVQHKSDHSPVTLADERAEALIITELEHATPDIPVIAEERAAKFGLAALAPDRFWLVDPLDGTREFVKRNGEFTINIGLVEGDRVVLGIIHVPVSGVTYSGCGPGTAAQQEGDAAPRTIAARITPSRGAIVIHSRSHADETRLAAFAASLPQAERRVSGSAVKFCLLAAGEADFYPRFGTTMEWDTAAGQAVLEAAGGSVTTLDGAPLRYAKPGFRNPDFIARGRAA
jgi:3'(2'), 5'-bisphosphate nucleotidase